MSDRLIVGFVVGWVVTLVGVMAYWTYGESLEPGRQYADALWPCVYIACFGGLLGGFVGAMTGGRHGD